MYMRHLIALLCLLVWSSAHAQVPLAPEPTICIPAEQARILDATAQRYEKLKPAFIEVLLSNQHYERAHLLDSTALNEKAKTISYYQKKGSNDQVLIKDATYKATFWQKKARKRGLLVALEAIGLALAGYLLLKP